jgi:ribonuclease VapC
MIVDTSALIAIAHGEPDAALHLSAIERSPVNRLAAPGLVEFFIVAERSRDARVYGRIDELLRDLDIAIEPFTAEHAGIARQAYRDFGRGSGHPARLNLGDCFAYALAKATGEPLLYKGDDFVHTDIRSALEG